MSVAAPPIASPVAPRGRARLLLLRRVGFAVLVILVVGITFFPVYWMVVSAIQPTAYSLHYPPPLWPQGIDLAPFRDLFAKQPIGEWLLNSAIVSAIATTICVVLAIFGAYAMVLRPWRGKGAFAGFLLVTQMLPEALIVVPIFRLFTNVPVVGADLRNNLAGLALIDAAFVLPICVWVLKNMFDTIPPELREAAMVDGAGPFRALFQVLLPLALPGIVAVGVVAFFYAWNEYLFAQLMVNDNELYPATVGLGSMKTMLDTPIEQVMAAGLLFAIPPVVFYIVLQRSIVAGITAGAVKG
ncbi:MAG: carbohydrate ABC transporter permease [Chloroflexia bacterium]|nr:carbohydrate ABC transporter permease [Chloroflexia bacterium]